MFKYKTSDIRCHEMHSKENLNDYNVLFNLTPGQ